MQWVQDPIQRNVDNLNNVRRGANKHFRDIKKDYLKDKILELETDGKIKNIKELYRGINDFRKAYQARPNTVKHEMGDKVTDFHSILARWRNHFSQLLNENGVNGIGQTGIPTAELLVHQPSAFEVELTIEKLRSHKSPGIDQIPTELIKAGGLGDKIEKNEMGGSCCMYGRGEGHVQGFGGET